MTVVARRGKSVGRYVPRPVAQLQVAVAESVVQCVTRWQGS